MCAQDAPAPAEPDPRTSDAPQPHYEIDCRSINSDARLGLRHDLKQGSGPDRYFTCEWPVVGSDQKHGRCYAGRK